MPVTSTFFDSSLYRSMLKLISTPTDLGRSGSPRLGQLPGSSHGTLSRRRQSRARRLSTAIPKNRLKEKKEMNGIRKTMAAAAIAGSMLVGGVAGAVLYSATVLTASAATPSPSPSAGTSAGKFVPNEDPAHEATESAAREAQENAGQVPTVP